MPARHGGRGGPREPPSREVQISKKLSWLLRHGAEAEGLKLDPSGFANLADVLANRNIRGLKPTLAEIQQLVESNDKQRYTLRRIPESSTSASAASASTATATAPQSTELSASSTDPRDYEIRANQGHSIKLASADHLRPLTATDSANPPVIVHGTTRAAWPRIVASGGLKPMGRNHVHFAAGLPAGFAASTAPAEVEGSADTDAANAPQVISGMRMSSTVLIWVAFGKAKAAGLQFWVSDNGVILCEGDAEGRVPLEVFARVEERGGDVLLLDGKIAREAPEEWSRGKERRS